MLFVVETIQILQDRVSFETVFEHAQLLVSSMWA